MKIAIGFCLAIVSCGVFAQTDSTNMRVLTFDEAVKIALEKSVNLNTQRNNFELSQAQRTSAIAGVGPSVRGNLSTSRVDGNFFNTNTGQLANGVTDYFRASISADMNLFSGFSQINTIRQFSSQLQAQNYLVHRTAQDVINTVSTQYLTVMLDKELLIIARENFVALTTQLEQVREQVNLGSKSPVDEYNQEAQTKAAELRYIQAEIQLDNDKATLAQTLLMDPFESFDVEKPNWDINMFDTDALNAEELADRAKQSRGDYLSAVKSADAQRFGMYAARGQMMPSLTASFTYGSAYTKQHGVPDSLEARRTIIVADPLEASGYRLDSEPTGIVANPSATRPFEEQFRRNNVQKQYGLTLTIPIFNGFQSRTNHFQRKVQYRNSLLTKNNLEFQIRNDVIRAIRNYEGARKAFVISTDQLKAAELAFQLETERYNLGVTSFVDYANANRVYVQAKTDKAQAEYRLVFQKVVLEYAVGTLKTESASMQN
jgi:outer membrane protein